ncbi:RluA family pseudouridine synthase [Xinfangfangia sp. CPCC 101601]|uniref:Pseudouridine synthase n=1 Tax=Pseudogemmobacter lacusdianii TaxID=3069608 RepID=A0ABU0VWY8_9RHOB|nr:RluA family pseudouridine synthase [Xinfangfangia sp. CPCC 101601]MDQ2066274.1 RluA family pseudouridine synthase [Xinfangfangia sp. CPCC 101601]
MIPDFVYTPPDVPLSILYEDRHILVLDKPSGLLSVPGKLEGRQDCLVSRLQAERWDALLVHRLDCDTSGVIIFARTKDAQGFLGQEFEKRRAKKSYIARVAGEIAGESGHIDLPLGADWPNRPRQMVDHDNGRPAQTDWQVIGRAKGETRVKLTPHTGRSHQLRVHMLALGHPILGDPIYASGAALEAPRLMLHAHTLALHHPETREMVAFEAPVPF